jgi:hypothetical protein
VNGSTKPGRRAIPAFAAAALLAGCASAGSSTPEPPAPAPAAVQAPADTVRTATPGDLPAARRILDRYVEAIGGRAAVMRTRSSHTTGLFEVPAAGLVGQIDVYAAAPNRMFVKTNFPQMGEVTSGYDGTTAWSVDPMQGPMLLEGKQLEDTRVQADFFGRLHEPANFSSIETTGLVDFEGKQAYSVRLVRTNGDVVEELFDPTTGLLVGSVATRDTPMGPVTVTSVVSDYKKFGDQLVPTRVVQKVAGQEIVVTISSVTYDSVDPAIFELPASIKALKQ